MSLLDRGTEDVMVFLEESVTDGDGNTKTRPSAVGVVATAVVQPLSFSGSQDGGFDTTSKYRLRLVGYPGVLGAQSQIEWNGRRYLVDGEPKIYNGSRRTAHVDYVMSRR